jgi:hypothetical protein
VSVYSSIYCNSNMKSRKHCELWKFTLFHNIFHLLFANIFRNFFHSAIFNGHFLGFGGLCVRLSLWFFDWSSWVYFNSPVQEKCAQLRVTLKLLPKFLLFSVFSILEKRKCRSVCLATTFPGVERSCSFIAQLIAYDPMACTKGGDFFGPVLDLMVDIQSPNSTHFHTFCVCGYLGKTLCKDWRWMCVHFRDGNWINFCTYFLNSFLEVETCSGFWNRKHQNFSIVFCLILVLMI